MKNFALFFTAISALFAISCNKEAVSNETNLPPVEGMKIVTFSATVAKEATKTSYSGEGTFSWTAGDEISVACSNGSFYTFTATKSGAKTTFTGYIPEGTDIGTRAYFPADPDHTDTQFCVTKEKDLRSHPSADLPMVGTGSKVGDDYKFSFSHCSGAALLTIDNIPTGIKYVEISVENAGLNLSGQFTLYKDGETDNYNWDPKSGDGEHQYFIRKVNVLGNSAQIYLPYSSYPDRSMFKDNTVNVTGYDKDDVPTVLIKDKSMKALGTFNRAQVKPLTPLIYSNLANINWSDPAVFTSNLDMSSSKKCLTQLKVSVDAYYLYAKVTAPVSGFSGDFLDIFLSDGSGSHYALSDDNQYWTTGGETVYREQHKGTVTTSSLSMTFNSKSVETKATNDGTDINYYMAFPRSAHSLLSSTGTVYVSFMLWNGWSCTGCIPTRYSAMMSVTLP